MTLTYKILMATTALVFMAGAGVQAAETVKKEHSKKVASKEVVAKFVPAAEPTAVNEAPQIPIPPNPNVPQVPVPLSPGMTPQVGQQPMGMNAPISPSVNPTGGVVMGGLVANPGGAPQGNNEYIYGNAMRNMHEQMMMVRPSGDVDVDFVQGMLPHHQGAVEMAKIVLEKGKDPDIKKLATEIIKAQEAEIKLMNEWLVKQHR